jgi:hypothetical protein
MDNQGASLTTQCLAFCQALSRQGQEFTLALTVGADFSFSLKTKEAWKKKQSPSSLERNARRKEEFLNKPAVKHNVKPAAPSGAKSAVVEKPSTVKAGDVKPACDQCKMSFLTTNGLKVHKDMMHMENPTAGQTVSSSVSSESQQELKCGKCQYFAKSKGMLTMHIEVQHSSFPVSKTIEVQCKTCRFKARTVEQLKKHVCPRTA